MKSELWKRLPYPDILINPCVRGQNRQLLSESNCSCEDMSIETFYIAAAGSACCLWWRSSSA
jgi:hypothetical protein